MGAEFRMPSVVRPDFSISDTTPEIGQVVEFNIVWYLEFADILVVLLTNLCVSRYRPYPTQIR